MNEFNKHADIIGNQSFCISDKHLPDRLRMEIVGNISVYYPPFNFVNTKARLVICGITLVHDQNNYDG